MNRFHGSAAQMGGQDFDISEWYTSSQGSTVALSPLVLIRIFCRFAAT